jgi:hypothetical protein
VAANRWQDLIDQWEVSLRKAFLESVYALRDSVQIEQVARMLERGDIPGAIRAVGLDPALFRPLDKGIADAFEAGGRFTGNTFPVARAADGLRVVFQFNIRNPSAEAWLRSYSSEKITEIVDDQREVIRTHLTAGMQNGDNPRTVALELAGRINKDTGKREGGVLGLTSSQAEWVRAYRDELASESPTDALTRNLRDKRFDAAVRKAEATGEPIPADVQEKMVRAYANRALRYRAETIGRTEAMASLHQSQEEATQQGLNAGVIQASNLKEIWRSARDKRVRDTHRALDGQTINRGERFRSPSGALLRYPGDPDAPGAEVIGCRCWRELSYSFLNGVE